MSKVNDLLASLDEAFDRAEGQSHEAATARAAAAEAIGAAQAAFDAVKATHDAAVQAATVAHQDALMAVDRLREQVNERVGALTGLGTNPRVVVRS